MRNLLLVMLLVTASCRRQVVVTSPTGPNTPGGATAREATQLFLAAAKAQDLQAMSNVWGTTAGPARTTMDAQTLEQRELIMMCYLKHDSYRIVSETQAQAGERMLTLEMKFRDLTRQTTLYATRGPSDRWYVRSVELEPLRDICARKT